MARNAERMGDQYSAVRLYSSYLESKPGKHSVRWDLADLQEQIRDYDSAYSNYRLVKDTQGDRYPLVDYRIASIQMRLGEYERARETYESFIKKYRDAPDYREYRTLVKAHVAGCDSSIMLMESPLNTVIGKLGTDINNPHADGSPFLVNETLVFSSLRQDELTYFHIDSLHPKRRFYSTLETENISEWVIPGVSPEADLSSASLNEAGDRLYFSQCEVNWKNKRICNLYRSDKQGNSWSSPIGLDEINSNGFSSSMPAVAIEARKGREVIYFVSDRPEGKGGKDIWYSIYDERKGRYREPRNLGKRVNSSRDELSPFYDKTERRLYFSSEGWSGLGGFDIYSTRGELRKFRSRTNVGYPINTGFDEVAYILNADRKSGYLVSNRSKQDQLTHPYCCDDIYRFEYPDKVILGIGGYVMEVDKEVYFQGDGEELDGLASVNSRPIPHALSLLYLLEDGEEILIDQQRTDDIGFYYFDIEPEKEYRVEISNQGFLNNMIELNTNGITRSDTLFFNMGMSEISMDDVVLENIEFEFNSAEMDSESKAIVDRSLLSMLQENPDFGLKISAHTDNKGTPAYNQDLSERRANSLVSYLVSKGISATRLQARGHGETRPIESNTLEDGSDNPEGRMANRRIEIQLMETGVR